MQNNTPLVRIVDDDEGIRNSMAFLLEGEGWEVKTYRDGSQFLASNDFSRPGCIILDVRMPNMSGLGLQTHLNEMGVDLPIIFLSGHGDIDMAVHTMKHGAVEFLQKPVREERCMWRNWMSLFNSGSFAPCQAKRRACGIPLLLTVMIKTERIWRI